MFPAALPAVQRCHFDWLRRGRVGQKDLNPGAFEQKDGNGDPSYSIRLPLSEDNTGICVSSTHDGTAIAMADLERGLIDFIRVDHNTGEVTRWTTENVPFSDIYDLPMETD